MLLVKTRYCMASGRDYPASPSLVAREVEGSRMMCKLGREYGRAIVSVRDPCLTRVRLVRSKGAVYDGPLA